MLKSEDRIFKNLYNEYGWEIDQAIKREDLIDNIKFNTPNARVKNKVERRKIIAQEIAKQSCEDVLSRLQDQQVPSAPILSREEVIENEQVLENNIIQ